MDTTIQYLQLSANELGPMDGTILCENPFMAFDMQCAIEQKFGIPAENIELKQVWLQ